MKYLYEKFSIYPKTKVEDWRWDLAFPKKGKDGKDGSGGDDKKSVPDGEGKGVVGSGPPAAGSDSPDAQRTK